MQTTRRILSDGWRVRPVPDADVPAHNHLPWLPARVPGHVHLDLMRAGVIPDPFARMHEYGVAWVDDRDWVYETTFSVEDPAPPRAYLVFQGLDTVAEIELNGTTLGRTDNMYIPHEFPVGRRLTAGANTLRVTFRAARRVGLERRAAWNEGPDPAPPHWDSFSPRSFVRKAQYMYGWDWGPVLLGCGLWRPVELVTVPVARIVGWKYDYVFTDENTVAVTITAEVERLAADAPLTLTGRLNIKKIATKVSVPDDLGTHTLTMTLPEATIERWQVNGTDGTAPRITGTDTEQHIYTVGVELRAGDGSEVETFSHGCGFRTLELLHEPDAGGQGAGFKFRVNGHDLFIKGANWIPNDSFPSRTFDDWPERMRERVLQARDAGFNMLRVWGGGVYESEDFYSACDEYGLLVWQDFPYACAYYPDTGEYAEAACVEATAAVRRIRSHPSLALWCGNNENSMMFHENWHGARPERLIGEKLYLDVLPAVVAAEDPKTPYWPSSPFGGENPNSATHGDCHNWDVWHGRGDWTHYSENDSRFCSEFGFASSCGLAAWDAVFDTADKSVHSPAVRWHDKTRKGYDTYLGYIGLHFPDPQNLEDLVYYSQLNQAEALKYGVEHYRRRKGHCWGTLFWQLNDCWPVQSWAVIDSLGAPKAALFAAKKFYAPMLLSLVRDGNTATAHLVNDHLHPVVGTLTLALAAFEGVAPLVQEIHEVRVGPNGAEAVATFDLTGAAGRERELYVQGVFQPGTAGSPVENLLLLAEPKDLRLSDPGLNISIQPRGPGAFVVTLTARRFAPYVWLRRSDNVPLKIDDNFFHLRPGQTRELVVARPADIADAADLRSRLVVRTL